MAMCKVPQLQNKTTATPEGLAISIQKLDGGTFLNDFLKCQK